ncbi:hypothetical protein [Agrobacterium tumefaciens]|uniref:hypothetical protein n=1 Tax=Agrobacterium tumefaciens TaxID=358 RepID=UPI00046F42C0
MDDEYDFVITRKPDPPRVVLFECLICEKEIENPPTWHHTNYIRGSVKEREPICKSCASQWGNKISGPVFNRQNFHTLKQLSAMITRLQWEVRNGSRHW